MLDVRLQHTADGGEIEIARGRVKRDGTPATAAYVSLFGGNERDGSTTATEALQWWGNRIEQDQTRHLRSETQHLLRALPATSGNLPRIEAAAARDLAWMTQVLGAEVSVRATIPGLNRVALHIEILIDGEEHDLLFEERWGGE
ncbi:MAG: hypothetical protein ACOC9T_00500 [Myxococcota bacterium]